MVKKFTVIGMTCSACSATVERSVSKIEGTNNVTVNLISGILSVEMDDDLTPQVIAAVKGAGYGIKEGVKHKRGSEGATKLRNRLFVSVPLVILLMYVSMGHMLKLPLPEFVHIPFWFALIQAIIALPVLIINGKFFTVGFKNLFTGKPNMDSLVALGSFASYAYGVFALVMIGIEKDVDLYKGNLYFEGAAMILTLITVGKFLEEKSKNKTMSAIEKLIDLTPDTATVMVDGKEIEMKTADLKAGDIIVLKSGFTAPADGVIISGGGYLDESVITGESIPVYKGEGEKVICGTSFSGGYALFKAENVGEDSTVFKIVKLVEDANSTKVPIARVADKVAGIFVPTVIAISLLAFVIWLLVGKGVTFAVNIAVSVLVVSCPCALGLATPAALMAGTGKSAENGILVKSGAALQALASVDSVVLDKTGTITFGKPEIEVYEHIGGLSDREFIGICAALEARSSHILAEPIVAAAKEISAENYEVEGFESVAGKGVKGVVDGKCVAIGNFAFMSDNGVSAELYAEKINRLENEGATVLYCAFDGRISGYISIKDKIKPSSYTAVAAFKEKNIDVLMLTGDGDGAAKAVAGELGIDYRSKVLPSDKHTYVKALSDSGKCVMMIGDGVNDAPALTQANVGVAIGAGTDIAIESADVVLIKNDLCDAVEAVSLGKAVMLNIKENLFWAFFYNVILIPIACGALYVPLGILLNPMYASLAMSLSSIFVVGNALRLRFFKFKTKNKENKGEETMFGKKEITTVHIDGMMCEHCKKRVETILSEFGKAKVDLKAKKAEIINCSASDEVITRAISDAGYKVTGIDR